MLTETAEKPLSTSICAEHLRQGAHRQGPAEIVPPTVVARLGSRGIRHPSGLASQRSSRDLRLHPLESRHGLAASMDGGRSDCRVPFLSSWGTAGRSARLPDGARPDE